MANIYEELAAYADMIVVPGITVGALTYANSMTLFSTSIVPLTAGAVAANSIAPFFQTALGEVGQGLPFAATLSQTNNRASKGTFPKNQVFICTHLGYEIFGIGGENGVTEYMLPPSVLFAVADQFSWDLEVGRGNRRTIGSLLEYGAVSGAYAANGSPLAGDDYTATAQNGLPGGLIKKLAVPIVFAPQIPVDITAKCGNGFTLVDQEANTLGTPLGTVIDLSSFGIRCHARGYLMTSPV